MRIYILACFVLFFSRIPSCVAQPGAGLPVQFIQFFKTYNLINPASIGKDAPLSFNTGNKSLTGAFSGVRTFYFNANVQLNPSEKRSPIHVLGLSFINDKEGSFINRNRASLIYAFHLPISKRVTLSAGAAVGFLNFAYKASNISAGGSAFAPNADVGLWLSRSDFNIGVSSNQIIASSLTPIDATYTIERHYNLIAEKTFVLSPYIAFTPAFVFRWFDQNYYNADLALIMLIQENLSVAIGYKYQSGASVSGGLEKIKLGRHALKLMLSYYTPVSGITSYNAQSYELSFQFVPAKRKKGEVESQDDEE
jgi:type IX secretion system PorP/SprF family membrane protein